MAKKKNDYESADRRLIHELNPHKAPKITGLHIMTAGKALANSYTSQPLATPNRSPTTAGTRLNQCHTS